MVPIPLLTAAIVVTLCDITNVNAKIESGVGMSILRNNFFGPTETLNKQPTWSKVQQRETNQVLKDIAARSKDYNPDLDKPIFRVDSEEGIAQILHQSDVVLTKEQTKHIGKDVMSDNRTKRQVLIDYGGKRTWKDGFFYSFNTSDPVVQKVFKLGTKVWSENTCIDFVENKKAKDKVVVVNQNGCWSSIGRRGGDQLLSISADCSAEAVHEIGHALGLFHTMSRHDRDNFIKVEMQNVDPKHINEFEKVNRTYAAVYGLSYDYGSIMHYSELSWSGNNQPTIIALNSRYQQTMGSDLISFSDIYVINEHYGCNARCKKSTFAKCANEGFPHPRNCSICICPGGYGGALCDQRPPGCGEDLVASSEEKTLFYRLGSGPDLKDSFNICNYMITAPAGKKIQVDVQMVSYGYDTPGCVKGGVEIKAQKDQKLTGYRFCSLSGSGGPVVSSSNHLPVILFNKIGTMQTIIKYRYTN